jgi:Ca-activated chloride channel family protein
MKIIARLSRSRVAEDQRHDLDLLVRLRAPAPPADRARPAVCVVPVVDVSGSMAGTKIAAVRRALLRLVDHLVPGDRIGLVAFDSQVTVPVPVVEATEARKADLRRAIRRLRAGSSTNLSGGLLEGLRRAQAASGAGVRARVVLLTDGMANEGVATTRETLVPLVREHAGGVAVSAFGYGDDCDQVLLGEMAEAGGGGYAYVRNDDVVLGAFARELGGLLATYAADVRVKVEGTAWAAVEEKLGDLLYHGELTCVTPIAAPAHVRAGGVEVGAIEAAWLDERGREQRARVPVRLDYVAAGEADAADDAEVARARDERLLRLAQERAEAHARGGEIGLARQAMLDAIRGVADAALAAFAIEVLLPCYADEEAYAARPGVRASSMMALKRKRMVAADESVGAAFDVGPSDAEAAMERSFRDGGGNGAGAASGANGAGAAAGRPKGRRSRGSE